MSLSKQYQAVLDALQGQTKELQGIPPERLDWAGPGALLELYRKTSGSDRDELIRAFGQVIESAAPPAVIAQLIDIASALELAQVEPQVRDLQTKPVASQEPLRGAITNYLALRQLNTSSEPARLHEKKGVRGARTPRRRPAKARAITRGKTAG